MNGVSYTGAEIYVNNDNRSPFSAEMKDFGPRLGFSWQLSTALLFAAEAGSTLAPARTWSAVQAQQRRILVEYKLGRNLL